MMKFRMGFLKTVSSRYKYKVMISFFIIVMLPIIVLLMVSHSSLVSSYENEVLKRDKSLFEDNSSDINSAMNQLQAEVVELKANSTLMNFFRTSEFSGDILFAYYQYIENILTWESMLKPDTVKEYIFFTNNRNIPRSEQIRLLEDLPDSLDIEEMKSALQREKYMVELIDSSNIDITNKYVYNYGYYLYFPFIVNEQYYTLIQVEMDINRIAQDLERFKNSIYYLQFDELGYYNVESSTFGQEKINDLSDTDNYMLYESDVLNGKVRIVKYTHIPTLLYDVKRLEKRFWEIVVSCFFALTIIIYIFASALTRKLVRVSQHIELLDGDNLELLISTENKDEVDILINHINLLTQRVKGLTEKKYETELQLKRTEIWALQNQITPHFLYNTLESFKMLALINNQKELSYGLTSLGQLLRYYTNTGNRMSNVEQELTSVKDYICIQNLLQDNRITLVLEIKNDIGDVPIPNLILQPIIENVVKHGTAKQTDPIGISIESYLESDRIILKINDNGKGIGKETVSLLNQNFQSSHEISDGPAKNHIGLINVNQRIKLLMGHDYGLFIDPDIKKGTSILVVLPKKVGSRGI